MKNYLPYYLNRLCDNAQQHLFDLYAEELDSHAQHIQVGRTELILVLWLQ
jgi:hypothetical protein